MNKRFNEDLYRSLSTYSRISIINYESGSIPKEFRINENDNEALMDAENLSFSNMVLFAKGLIDPELLGKVK